MPCFRTLSIGPRRSACVALALILALGPAAAAKRDDTIRFAYDQALDLIAERAYGVPLYTMPVYYAASPDLVFKAPPDEILRFWEMRWR